MVQLKPKMPVFPLKRRIFSLVQPLWARRVVQSQNGFSIRWIMAVGVLSLGITTCAWLPRAPARIIPTTPPELSIEIVAMDKSACVGDLVSFVIKTTPGNECLGDIGYSNAQGSWVGPSFEPIVADGQGICEWTWEVPSDAAPGEAAFRAGVRGYGTMSSIMPQVFEIQICAQ